MALSFHTTVTCHLANVADTDYATGHLPSTGVRLLATLHHVTDIRLSLDVATPLALYDPLRPNVTSFIKPEVHYVSQRRQRMTEPRPLGSARKIREDRSGGSRDMLADRQTDRQTMTILRSPTGAE